MLPGFASDTVTVVEPAWVDDRGTMVPDYTTPVSSTVVPGCSVQPGASPEDLAGRQNVIVRWTALLPAGVAITAYSQVIHQGVAYSVDGEPERWPSPTGALDHLRAYLVDWNG